MLNLEELERKLDNALSNEDAQALTDWLLNLRKDNNNAFLGLGYLEEIKSQRLNNSYVKVISPCYSNSVYFCQREDCQF